MATDKQNPIYLIFMLLLSFYAVLALGFLTFFPISPEIRKVIEMADTAVCLIFLADFVLTLIKSERKWHYFHTWGWLDLISSIPTIDIFRWGRAARILRIIRVLRAIRATRILSGFIFQRRSQSTFMAACLISILLVIVSSIALLQFETSENANIKTAEDAVWWAVTTITTVGYGDRYPISSEGRFVAALLMASGVGLFGTFTGFIASWFLTPPTSETKISNEAILAEITELKQIIQNHFDTK